MCVGGILVVNFIGVAVVLHFALRDPSFAVEERYYEKALAWDEQREQEQRNKALGWETALSQVPAGTEPTQRVVSVALNGPDGVVLEGAVIEYEAFNAARAGERFKGTFVEVGDGRYDAVMTVRYPGVWVFRLRCVRGEDMYTEQTELRIVPSAAGR